MKKKGVSNLIASVLLIVITLSVASVLYGWSTGWISQRLGEVQQVSQGELAYETATFTGSNDSGIIIVRNVGNESITICDSAGNLLLTLYINGTIIPSARLTPITNQTTGGTNLKVANATLPPDNVMQINFSTAAAPNLVAGTTYEVMLTLSDGTPLIFAITAI